MTPQEEGGGVSDYVPHTDEDRSAMLAAIGVAELEDLFDDVPERFRFPDLDLPAPISESEIEREMRELARANADMTRYASFLGAGTYRHFVPATVDAVLRRGELFTSYTPYQPELSQGLLQATFEYQSMICALTGMDVSTASHYDGATALAEGVLLALAVGGPARRAVVAPVTVHPQYRDVLRTYLAGTGATLTGDEDLRTDPAHLVGLLDDVPDGELAACVVQSPDFFGRFEPVPELARRVHDAGGLLIVVADPIALGLFRAPGGDGADVVVAEGQPLGLPVSFGGPHLGILATRRAHARRTPGRLVGETLDVHGERGYVLTLSTREQHIRREKATSNICTNAALSAVAAAVYLATVGRSGLRWIAELTFHRSHYAAAQIAAIPGCSVNPDAPGQPFFREFVTRLPVPVAEANRVLRRDFGVIGGYDLGRDHPGLDHDMLVAVTEMNPRADIDRLVDGLRSIAAAAARGEVRP